MKRFFKLTLILVITVIALAISNTAYADDEFPTLTKGDLLTQTESTSTSYNSTNNYYNYNYNTNNCYNK